MGSGKKRRWEAEIAEGKAAWESWRKMFSWVCDWRDRRGLRHRSVDILTLTVIGFMWGYTDFANMCECFRRKRRYLTGVLGLPNGIPSHDTFSRFYAGLHSGELEFCFLMWMDALMRMLGGHVVLDGKAIRAVATCLESDYTTYVEHAFSADYGLYLGQVRVGKKSNEITAIPELLKLFDLTGVTITIDSMGCQSAILGKIASLGGGYVIPVKENQKSLLSDVSTLVEWKISEQERLDARMLAAGKKPTPVHASYDRTSGKDHGRFEIRRCWTTPCPPGTISPKGWESVAAVGKVIRETETISTGKKSVQTVYYLINREMDAREFGRYVRSHWAIENSGNYVADERLREDRCTARTGFATENLTQMRRIALNLIRLYEMKIGKKLQDRFGFFRENRRVTMSLIIKPSPPVVAAGR